MRKFSCLKLTLTFELKFNFVLALGRTFQRTLNNSTFFFPFFFVQVPITTTTSGYQYNPALRGGVPVFPPQPQPSPQGKRKATPTRPISFVRALEMADSMEMQAMAANDHKSGATIKNNGMISSSAINNNAGNQSNTQKTTTPTPDRASVYDVNYEISV